MQCLQRYANAVAGKDAPLHNCFNFVHEAVARICRPVLNERPPHKGTWYKVSEC